jgi:hypothetical protein
MALSKPTGKLAFAYQSIAILEAARKQDEALIWQMLEALEKTDAAIPSFIAQHAIAAARARLAPSTASPRS